MTDFEIYLIFSLTRINMDQIVYYLKRGALECSEDKFITIKDLQKVGAIKDPEIGVKLLGKGNHLIEGFPIFIEVTDASESTIETIHKNGGQVILINLQRPLFYFRSKYKHI